MNRTHNLDNLDMHEDRWLDASYEDKYDYEYADYNDWANGDDGEIDDDYVGWESDLDGLGEEWEPEIWNDEEF